jgi:hypothetical protein
MIVGEENERRSVELCGEFQNHAKCSSVIV